MTSSSGIFRIDTTNRSVAVSGGHSDGAANGGDGISHRTNLVGDRRWNTRLPSGHVSQRLVGDLESNAACSSVSNLGDTIANRCSTNGGLDHLDQFIIPRNPKEVSNRRYNASHYIGGVVDDSVGSPTRSFPKGVANSRFSDRSHTPCCPKEVLNRRLNASHLIGGVPDDSVGSPTPFFPNDVAKCRSVDCRSFGVASDRSHTPCYPKEVSNPRFNASHSIGGVSDDSVGLSRPSYSTDLVNCRSDSGHSTGVFSDRSRLPSVNRLSKTDLLEEHSGKPKLLNWREGYEPTDATATPKPVDDSIWCATSSESDGDLDISLNRNLQQSIDRDYLGRNQQAKRLDIRSSKRKVGKLEEPALAYQSTCRQEKVDVRYRQRDNRTDPTSRYIRPMDSPSPSWKSNFGKGKTKSNVISQTSFDGSTPSTKIEQTDDPLTIDLCNSDNTSAKSFPSPTSGNSDLSFDPLASVTAVANLSDNFTTEYAAPDFLDYDQTYMASRTKKQRCVNSSIDRNVVGPVIQFSPIPIYNHDIDSAPRRDFLFVCERPILQSYVPTMEPREPLMWPETHAVDIWRRGVKGMALRNRLDVCSHYEIDGANLDRFQRDATQKGILPVYHPADGKVKMVSHDGHHLFLCNGGDFRGILEDMDLRSVLDDLSHKSDPGMVPKKNKRGNRGPSLIYTGSQSTERAITSQFAVPNLSCGSRRYAPLYVKITKAIRLMSAHRLVEDQECFPKSFPVSDEMPDRQMEWGGRVIDGNCIESCSLLIYYSDHSFSTDGCDKLKPHVDRGNGIMKGWDVLATFWEEFFCADIGRWILFVVSATTRRSIEDYNDRKKCIGFATDEILRRYASHPDCQRNVVAKTLCPRSTSGDHRVMPIHFDTLVFLSIPLWHIHRMRGYWSTRGQEMSLFLAQEMLLGFFKSNNPLRYHRFADKVYRETVASGCLAIPSKSTFMHELETYLFTTFGGWNGTTNARGVVEGSMRFQTTTNSPQSDWAQDKALIFWNHYSRDLATRFGVKGPTEKDHTTAIRAMKNEVIGVGDLLAQKIIFADATLGLTLPLTFLANCTPGSSQHFKVLKQCPFNFKQAEQVKQLVTSISVKGHMVRQKAEEAICLTLKSNKSLEMYAETSVKHCDLFSSAVDREHRLSVSRLDFETKRHGPVERGGFTVSPGSHYYPKWAKYKDPSKYCTNNVRMTSRTNFIFNVKPKVTATQIRDLENERVHSAKVDTDFSFIQILLNSNKFLFLEDPIDELSRYLRVSKQRFIQSIEVRSKGDGFVPFLDMDAFNAVRLDSVFLQISDIGISRRPLVDVGDCTLDGWNYKSRNGAILALFVHCITNVHLRHGNHWAIEYLQDTKEFVLLLPATRGLETASAIGTFFRNADENIRYRQVTKHCEVCAPIIVAKDYNGVFQKNKNVRRGGN